MFFINRQILETALRVAGEAEGSPPSIREGASGPYITLAIKGLSREEAENAATLIQMDYFFAAGNTTIGTNLDFHRSVMQRKFPHKPPSDIVAQNQTYLPFEW